MRSRCLVVKPASPRSFLPLLSLAPSRAASAIAVLIALRAVPAFADTAFTIASANFRAGGTVDNAQVFDRDDCKGNNRSPQLTWHNPPEGTRSFAITMFDPDSPGRGSQPLVKVMRS